MNKVIEKILHEAFKSKKDILCLIPREQKNFALVFSAPITTKLSEEANKKIKEEKKNEFLQKFS